MLLYVYINIYGFMYYFLYIDTGIHIYTHIYIHISKNLCYSLSHTLYVYIYIHSMHKSFFFRYRYWYIDYIDNCTLYIHTSSQKKQRTCLPCPRPDTSSPKWSFTPEFHLLFFSLKDPAPGIEWIFSNHSFLPKGNWKKLINQKLYSHYHYFIINILVLLWAPNRSRRILKGPPSIEGGNWCISKNHTST